MMPSEALMRVVSIWSLAVLSLGAAQAQKRPVVEVASVRVHSWKSTSSAGRQISGNRLTAGGNVNQLVMFAYDLKPFQISGGPDWVTHPQLEGDYFDINATAEGGEELTVPRARLLLQSVLADRFQLRVARETKEVPIYALVVARGGQKFRESKSDAACASRGAVTVTTVASTFTNCPIDSLIRVLAGVADRPVIDQSSLSGSYDFKVEFARDPAVAASETNAASIFTALQEQLGLKLESRRGPVEMVVIEWAERPSEN